VTELLPASHDDSKPETPASGIPEFSADELARAGVEDLLALLIEHEDRVPHSLFDACVARGASMVPCLDRQLGRLEEFIHSDHESGEWWSLLHAVHILGRLPDAGAGHALVRFMRALDGSDDDDINDWLAGMWPHFFTNKPADVIAKVHAMMRDDTLEWTCRAQASAVVVAAAMARGAEALEAAIDDCAAMLADESNADDLRGLLGTQLLDFPRSRHRTLLLRSVALDAEGLGPFFSEAEVHSALERQADDPEWLRLPDPYSFYDDDRIMARQIRWAEEAEAAERGADRDEELDDWEPPGIPFVREAPKVGRNDPCPCGSGRKYKKCCLE
jgi:hypothetical protein